MKQRYPWPASQLDEKDMQSLYMARKDTGKTITRLIKEAVINQYREVHDED